MPVPYQLIEHLVRLEFVPHSTGNYRWMNSQPVCQSLRGLRRFQRACRATLPLRFRDESFESHLVRFPFSWIVAVANVEVVIKLGDALPVVERDMRELVHQAKPEVIYSVVT